jgi:hypothetical protein
MGSYRTQPLRFALLFQPDTSALLSMLGTSSSTIRNTATILSQQKSFFLMQDLWSDIDEDQQSVCLQVNARVGERANQQSQDVLRATMWLTASVPALGRSNNPARVGLT